MKLFSPSLFALTLASILLCTGTPSPGQSIPLGKGSIASAPPALPKIQEFYATQPLLGPKARNRPLPTNDWWTSLLTESPFPGTLWSMPFAVQPRETGLAIAYPKVWNENGTDLLRGTPLEISGTPRSNGETAKSMMLFDFEQDVWPKTWKKTGEAFGDAPMPATQHAAENMSGNVYACSFYGGDQAVGTLTSPSFILTHDYIHFRVSGGNDAEKLGVELLVGNKVVYRTLGNQSNTLLPHRWDVKKYKNQRAQVRLIDAHTGGWGFIAADAFFLSDQPEPPSTGVFERCSTMDWGDWSIQFGLHAAGSSRFEVTLARGMPFVWIEPKEVDPNISVLPGDVFYNTDGSPATFPTPSSELVLSREGRFFSLYMPENCSWEKRGLTLFPVSATPIPFLIVGALPDLSQAKAFAKFAYTLPRDTRYEWSYQPESAEILTRWTVTPEILQGSVSQVLQGWLPHQWRSTTHELNMTPLEYPTQRGLMKVSRGTEFDIRYSFTGLPISLPLPDESKEEPSGFRGEVLDQILTDWITDRSKRPAKDRAGADTYWGGKEILSLARTATLADQRQHPMADQALEMLREALTDWCTYTPGEEARYFARYPSPWNGLVGFNPSYGSETFTDCHFHHGYFTLSAAMLIRLDPAWGKDYGEVIRDIARQYANSDRDSERFPFLRTFSPWVGHSYAGGSSNPNDGNNQESTSESMMAWSGLFLLGTVLNDDEMRDTGAMGLAVEKEAIREYWNDYYHAQDPNAPAVFPEAYRQQHTIAGVRRDRDMGYWTWFSGEAIHIYGIQWLPIGIHLQYLGLDNPQFIKDQSTAMLTRQGTDNFESLGRDWGHVALSQRMWGDPVTVCDVLEHSRSNGGELGDFQNGGATYAMAHALRNLGQPSSTLLSTTPNGTVYVDREGKRRWIGWNPGDTPVPVSILENGNPIFSFTVPVGKNVTTQDLPGD